MKICTIIYSHSPYNLGGADIYAESLSKRLASEGNESTVITTKLYSGLSSFDASFERKEGVKIYSFYPLNIFSIQNFNKKSLLQKAIWSLIDLWNPHSYIIIKQILKKEKPDVVHLHTPIAFSLSLFNAVKSLSIPLVFTLHEYYLFCRRSFLLHGNGEICNDPNANVICKIYSKFSKKIVDSKPDAVISPSKFALDMLSKQGFFENIKKIVLPYGIEVPQNPVEKIVNDYIDVLYLGSLVKHKGVDILVNAFKQIENRSIKLHIAGNGPLLENLKKIAEGDDRIKFYGWVSGAEKDSLLRLADILVLPSIWYENFPVSIQESFCYSVPVIGSRIGGIPELIRDEFNGFLFETGNILDLANILGGLTKDLKKLRKLGTNAYNTAKKFEINNHIKELKQIYSSVI